MVFVILNFIFGATLIAFSSWIDQKTSLEKRKSLINLFLVAAIIGLLVSFCGMFSYWQNKQITNLLGKLMLMLCALFSVGVLSFSFSFPYFRKHLIYRVFWILLLLAGIYLVTFKITTVEWLSGSLVVVSPPVGIKGYYWFDIFTGIFAALLPLCAFLAFTLRAVFCKSKIYRQQLFFSAIGLASAWLVLFLIWKLGVAGYHYEAMFVWACGLYLGIQYLAMRVSTVYDPQSIAVAVIIFIVQYFVPALLVGLIMALAFPLVHRMPVVYWALVLAVVFAALYTRPRLEKLLKRYIHFGSDYRSDLERELNALDYNEGSEVLIEQAINIIRNNTEAMSVDILIESSPGQLTTAYSTAGRSARIDVLDTALESLVNQDQYIVFKTQAVTKYEYNGIKNELLAIFDTCASDVLIVLREGRHVFGLVLLGPKKRGNEYSDYDFSVLSELYSNFFVIVYYIKNIANESVIGTVDREIEYSGQIIHSIQDNIDRIHNNKTDIDYLSLSARKLGGDFVDFIRLTNDRYIFITGDVSGKGLNASMSMVILKSVIRTFLAETKDFKELVVKVNKFIKFNLPKGTFFAGAFCLIDFSENTMYYINCGVPVMFLYTEAYNNAIEIQGDGKVLGFVKDISSHIKVKKIKLNPQDILLISTDGLIDSESLRGERFGKDRIQKFITDNRIYPAQKMAQFLYDSLIEFTSKQLEDDVTIVVMKYLSR